MTRMRRIYTDLLHLQFILASYSLTVLKSSRLPVSLMLKASNLNSTRIPPENIRPRTGSNIMIPAIINSYSNPSGSPDSWMVSGLFIFKPFGFGDSVHPTTRPPDHHAPMPPCLPAPDAEGIKCEYDVNPTRKRTTPNGVEYHIPHPVQ